MQFEIIQKRNSYVSSPSNRHETHQILRIGTLSLLIVFGKDTLSALYQPSKGAISSPVRLRSIQVYRRGERRGRSHASMIYGVRYFGSPQSIAISESSRNRERFRHPIEQNELLETPRGINLTATVPTLREIAPPYRQAWPPTRGLVFVTPPKIIAAGARFARENSLVQQCIARRKDSYGENALVARDYVIFSGGDYDRVRQVLESCVCVLAPGIYRHGYLSFFFLFFLEALYRRSGMDRDSVRRISCRFMVSNTVVVNFVIGLKRFVEGWERGRGFGKSAFYLSASTWNRSNRVFFLFLLV